ncbi:DUF6879 family protein [Streptomyces johnsoniae]|uniref:DUF6879 domain-containing protein n=1 Tax=Streptomyces johnsoniae TaxID=3075532 RepID=A0ABU2SCG8_9ACTN|nr:DUF6879 family protein [Streptomyces sp. DSM 41886]MDT0446667.1 hypothetical protein [Streptomyces sp. DSM 41886]
MIEEFRTEAFRLETLDNYGVSRLEGHFHAFLNGEPRPEKFMNSPWVSTVRRAVENDRRMYRVHVLSRPLTDYLRYELGWGYHRNMAAGEEFFILDTTDQPNPLEGVGDFWMYDESTVEVMKYEDDGKYIGSETLPSERVPEFVEYRNIAVSRAVPFEEWWEKYRE